MIAHVKIQFEINSQRKKQDRRKYCTCDCSRKNTIWNQFTTGASIAIDMETCDCSRKNTIWNQFTTETLNS